MRIAIVAYDFPPFNSGGSQRPYFLAKFLKCQNIHVVVFTLNESNYPSDQLNYKIDPEFLSTVAISRTNLDREYGSGRFFQSYYFNLVDRTGARWKDELEKALETAHSQNAFDFVLFTCPPFSLAVLGVAISKKIGVPLILDMRDAWTQWVTSPYATYFHYRATLKLEAEALCHATYITYTSKQQKKDWLGLHAEIDPDKFIYTPNGFTDYAPYDVTLHEGIRILYSGSFYYNPDSDRLINKPWYQKKIYQYLQYAPRVEEWKYRSPWYFFSILHRLLEKYPQLRKSVTVRFAGKKPYWFDAMVDEFALRDQVIHLGFLDKIQMSDELQKADYFLVTSSKVRNGRDYSVAGKTFEYFTYRKPIIGVVCEGEQKDMLERSGISLILDPDDPARSAEKLNSFLNANSLKPDWNYIEQFKVPNNYLALSSRIGLKQY